MKLANWIFGLLFLVAAVLQWNDPDPLRWFLVYLGAAVASLFSTYWQGAWKLAVAVGAAGALWAATLVPHLVKGFDFANLFATMKAENPEIEVTREFLGLLIIVGWMLAVVVFSRARRLQSGSSSG